MQRLFSFVRRVATLLVFTLHEDLCCPLFFMCSENEVNGTVKNAVSSLNDGHQTLSGLRLIFCAVKTLRHEIAEAFVNMTLTYLSGSRIIRSLIDRQ